MALTLQDVERITQTVAGACDRRLRVAGVLDAEGGAGYTEVMIVDERCTTDPCVVVIGIDRTLSESAFRTVIEKQLMVRAGS